MHPTYACREGLTIPLMQRREGTLRLAHEAREVKSYYKPV